MTRSAPCRGPMCAIAGIFQLDRPLTADLRQAARAMTVIGILLATAACGTADPATVKADAIRRGDALMVQQKHGEAVAAYLLAVEIDPRDGDLRLRLAKAHQSAHQWEDASRQFITAAELLPGNWDLQLEAVRWMLLLFRYSDAAHRSSALLKSKPDDPELLVLLGTAKARLRYFDMPTMVSSPFMSALEIRDSNDASYWRRDCWRATDRHKIFSGWKPRMWSQRTMSLPSFSGNADAGGWR